MPSDKIYTKLSAVYNKVMYKVRYDRWSEYLYNIADVYVSSDAEVLELAAGNCNFADYFKEYFPIIFTSDISFQMLSSAENKTIPKVCCDMTRLPFKKKFDLIFSTFDSVNYLLKRNDLKNLFSEVKKILKDEGIFAFDVSLENNSLIHVKKPVRRGNYKGISFVHKSLYSRRSKIHKNIFNIKMNGKVYTEVHRQKIYPFELYFDLIEKAGLYVVECMEAFSFIKANPESERIQFVVKKNL